MACRLGMFLKKYLIVKVLGLWPGVLSRSYMARLRKSIGDNRPWHTNNNAVEGHVAWFPARYPCTLRYCSSRLCGELFLKLGKWGGSSAPPLLGLTRYKASHYIQLSTWPEEIMTKLECSQRWADLLLCTSFLTKLWGRNPIPFFAEHTGTISVTKCDTSWRRFVRRNRKFCKSLQTTSRLLGRPK